MKQSAKGYIYFSKMVGGHDGLAKPKAGVEMGLMSKCLATTDFKEE
jgi:hypothetical protein